MLKSKNSFFKKHLSFSVIFRKKRTTVNFNYGLVIIVIVASVATWFMTEYLVLGLDSMDLAAGGWLNSVRPPAVAQIAGPLKVHPDNPRYFVDSNGNPVYLTGSHTWDNFQDWGPPTPNFDMDAYIEFLKANNHNFVRGWVWGNTRIDTGAPTDITPYIYKSVGTTADGMPLFDLDSFNEDYFTRMKDRVQLFAQNGIYVSIMLFQKSAAHSPEGWESHPYNSYNNNNNIDGDVDNDGDGREIYDLTILQNQRPEILALEEKYVDKLIDTLNNEDNVLWEIGNEIKSYSINFQNHFINYIHSYEAGKPKQHPVGFTSSGSATDSSAIMNSVLFASNAEWISPHNETGQDYSFDPPASDGSKVILADSDHIRDILWAYDGDDNIRRQWVWKSFLRGLNPIMMDPVQRGIPGHGPEQTWNDPSNTSLPAGRTAMGHTLGYAERMDLSKATPRNSLSSTGYCLADPGSEYLVYQHGSGQFSVNLQAGEYNYEWFNPVTGQPGQSGNITATNGWRIFTPTFSGEAVLYLFQGNSACPDGTPDGQCSGTQPQYCNNGTLEDRCSTCGCPAGRTCQANGTCAVSSPSVILHYTLDSADISGSQILDRSGNNHNSTIYGSPQSVSGQLGEALHFDGNDDYLVSGLDNLLSGLPAFTAAAWVKPSAYGNYTGIIQYRDRNGLEMVMEQRSSGVPRVAVNTTSGFKALDSITQMPLNTWTHFAFTYDGSYLRLYLDGQLDSSLAHSGSVLNNNRPLYIGLNPGDGINFNGAIDEVIIYNYALSQTAIEDLYNAAAPTDTTPPVFSVFDVQPRTTTGSITANWSVTDNVALAQVELWRAPDNGGSPGTWVQVANTAVSGTGASGSLTDTPPVGNFFYGLHALDQSDNMGVEPNPPGPIAVTKTDCGNGACNAGETCSSCPQDCGNCCGNGVIDTGEDCDGSNLNGATCLTRGYSGGTLACNADCSFNTGNCTSDGGGNIIYVSPGGIDQSGCGSSPKCKTIEYAAEQRGLGMGDTIYVEDGLYPENEISLPCGVSLRAVNNSFPPSVKIQPAVNTTYVQLDLTSATPGTDCTQIIDYIEFDGRGTYSNTKGAVEHKNRDNVTFDHNIIRDYYVDGYMDNNRGFGYRVSSSAVDPVCADSATWRTCLPQDLTADCTSDADIIAAGGFDWTMLKNLTFTNNEVYDCGYTLQKTKGDPDWKWPGEKLFVGQSLKDSRIENNIFDNYTNGKVLAGCIGELPSWWHNVDFTGNKVYGPNVNNYQFSGYDMELWGYYDLYIAHNEFNQVQSLISPVNSVYEHNSTVNNYNAWGGSAEFMGGACNVIRYNNWVDVNSGLTIGNSSSPVSGTYTRGKYDVYGNVISNFRLYGAMIYAGTDDDGACTNIVEDIYIYNNIFDADDSTEQYAGIWMYSIDCGANDAQLYDVRIENNIFTDVNGGGGQYAVDRKEPSNGFNSDNCTFQQSVYGNIVINNNAFYNNVLGNVDPDFSNYSNNNRVLTATPYRAHTDDLSTNLSLNNTTGGGRDCINTGVDVTGTYAMQPATAGINNNYDWSDFRRGDTVPVLTQASHGSAFEIGAYVYPEGPLCTDTDGDGYGACPNCGIANGCTYDGDDCDDNEEWANPGGTETCDTVDNNCSGQTDEGCDDDSDGYCDATMPVYRDNTMCPNTPFIDGRQGDDCDDTNNAANPGVSETCSNSTDDDCDGSVDEGCSVTACHRYTPTDPVQAGYGSAYNLAANNTSELLVKTTCNTNSVNLDVGNGNANMLIYERGHIYDGSDWQSVTLSGSYQPYTGWYAGNAGAANIPVASMNTINYIVAYTCYWNGQSWRCGCADSACIDPCPGSVCSGKTGGLWQLQAFSQ